MTNYRVIYARRKTLSLRLCDDGSVEVRAPYFVSRSAIDAFVQRHEDWLKRARETNAKKHAAIQARPSQAQNQALAQKLQILCQRYAKVMGVQYTSIKLTAAKKRFGSCNVQTGGLCFAKMLVHLPDELVEYVVVHELAHLVHPNHSGAFHAFVGEILPDAEERRKSLKGWNWEKSV